MAEEEWLGLWIWFTSQPTRRDAEPLQYGPGGLGVHAVDGDRGLRCGCAGISEDEARLLRATRLLRSETVLGSVYAADGCIHTIFEVVHGAVVPAPGTCQANAGPSHPAGWWQRLLVHI